MNKQLSFELENLSSGKKEYASPTKPLFRRKEEKPSKISQLQRAIELLPARAKGRKIDELSLEDKAQEEGFLKEPNLKKDPLFENLISVKTVAEWLGLAPKTIHNWVSLRKIPYVKCGGKVMFRPKSLKAWLNRKEIKSWQ